VSSFQETFYTRQCSQRFLLSIFLNSEKSIFTASLLLFSDYWALPFYGLKQLEYGEAGPNETKLEKGSVGW